MNTLSAAKLQTMSFFESLPLELIQTILDTGQIQTYSKKKLLFSDRELIQNVLFLLSGEVSVYNLTKHGNRKIIFFLGKGHLLNHEVQSFRTSSVYCETITQAKILKISKKEFRSLMEQHFSLTQAVLQEYERYLWRLTHQLKNTAGSLVTERKIAAKLWKLGRDFGKKEKDGIHITIPFTMTLMADFVGVPRENVSRACKSLSMKGLLIYQNRHFILPNPDGLAEFYKM